MGRLGEFWRAVPLSLVLLAVGCGGRSVAYDTFVLGEDTDAPEEELDDDPELEDEQPPVPPDMTPPLEEPERPSDTKDPSLDPEVEPEPEETGPAPPCSSFPLENSPADPDPPGYALVGACNYRCLNCARPGIVVGTRLDCSQQVIPVGVTPEQAEAGAGHTCGLYLPLGTEMLVEARPAPGMRFVAWESPPPEHPNRYTPCPCDGSPETSCAFAVTARTYCGAVYERSE
jgi:hypothetical protein